MRVVSVSRVVLFLRVVTVCYFLHFCILYIICIFVLSLFGLFMWFVCVCIFLWVAVFYVFVMFLGGCLVLKSKKKRS